MNHILVINSSASGDASVSRLLVADIVQRLVDLHPQARLTYRDVGEDPVPHLTPATLAGVRGVAQSEAEHATRTLSDRLIAELQAADLVVIGAPMYNFSIPSTLRTWFDHVLRPRVTFSYGADGPEGQLKGKHAIVVEARGGLYSEGPAQTIDFQEPYIRQLLGFMGITDVSFIHAEKIGFGPEAREAALASAREQGARAIARLAPVRAGAPAQGEPA
ncbi:FMN-dependent NADH-azoreductase [Herbaspirillum sp. GCM10030257]|uniref:FMN-dependent NADH-azoreductase n=1 Tax=Herbaspirillum sp. GCM10030257 TaxID=3273393 RepID=UPI00360FE968